jgi:hypothetical protein
MYKPVITKTSEEVGLMTAAGGGIFCICSREVTSEM